MTHRNTLSYQQIMENLQILCATHKTGTVFITSNDNRAVGFVLEDGAITSCSFGHWRGKEALSRISHIESGTYSFSEKVSSFMKNEQQGLPSNAEIFQLLGTHYDETKFLTDGVKASASESERVYRGQQVTTAIPLNTMPPLKKAVRIYRGQLIEE